MTTKRITIRISPKLLGIAEKHAAAADKPIGEFIRDCLAAALDRPKDFLPRGLAAVSAKRRKSISRNALAARWHPEKKSEKSE